MNPLRALLRRWLPRRWRLWLRRRLRPALYTGDHRSWEEARAASRGYADPEIEAKVIAAARAVRAGLAAWDRDTALFTTPSANEILLRALRRAAAAHGGHLNLVDFGGALGSAWWQHRPWLGEFASVRWSVVEQPALVAVGKREFETEQLRFFGSLAECCAEMAPKVALLSSVLPYLEEPHALLEELRRWEFSHIIIDRTGFVNRGRDRLTVQHVPPAIYSASYPCWFFDKTRLLEGFAGGWRVTAEWDNDDDVDIDALHRGMMLERNQP